MKKVYLFLFFPFVCSSLIKAQITTDYNAPNNNPVHLIDNVLLGGGVIASNHAYQGDSMQIGFFNGVNSNIGLDSGVVMSTGDISVLDPNFLGFGGTPFSVVTDPDLLNVANSVPPLIGQSFTVSSINDVAVLEFDFIPTSDSLFFRYVFGSNEYLTYVNTTYNDVFGFFISGPGITGPYSAPAGFPNGSVNIATVPNSNPALPITISSVNNVLNNPYYIDNQNILPQTVLCNGFTTVFTAKAQVQCGETYHIRLAIADGTDNALDSWVFLEAGSFTSPQLDVSNSLGIDTTNTIAINCNTTIDLIADMGVASATYLWSTGDTTQTITVGPGTYWVEASDSLNCSLISDTLYVVGPASPSVDLGADIDICVGEQTYLTPTVTGGSGPFTYSWSTGQFGPTIIVGGGNYTVTVTDANGCQASDDIIVTAHALPALSINPPSATICGGVPVTLTASGADSYVWTPSTSLNTTVGSVVIASSSSTISYTVEGTSQYGCVSQEDILINVSAAFIPISSATGVSCFGESDGVISTVINSGIAPFQYSIDGGQNFQFNNVFDQLSSGIYDLVVTDGNGCLVEEALTVVAPSAQIAVIANGSDAACSGTSSGDVWIESIVGGLPYDTGFVYTWYSTDDNSIVGYGSMLSGIPYGGYYVIAQDSIGCTGSSSVTVTESTGFTLDIQKTEPICVGGQEGSIYVGVTGGGVPPYTYDWSASTSNPADTFSTLYNLISGSYSLTITDNYGCDTTVLVTLLEPSLALSVQAEAIQSISCFEDSTGIARAVVVGGQSPYSYAWSGGHALDTAWGLWSSDHDVVVTDARGCSESSSVTITSNTAIESELSSTSTTCYGYSDGSALVSLTVGGVMPYQYMWSNSQPSSGISNLSFGQYTLTTTDAIGCISVDEVSVNQPLPLQSGINATKISCFSASDGILEAIASGGTAPYSYQWLDGSMDLGQDSVIMNLGVSANYQLKVTDANGCESLAFASLSEPTEIDILTSTVTAAYCEDVATGGISVIATGGTLLNDSDYSYAWDNPGPFQQLTSTLTNQEAGDYTVTVTDDNGCQQSKTINLPLQPTFESTTLSTSTSCYQGADGSATVNLSGGYAPYTHSWTYNNGNTISISTSSPSYTIANVPNGVYSVLIVDGNGCDISDTGFVSQPLPLEYQLNKLTDQSCYGDFSLCDGSIELIIEGGNSVYHYSWFDNQGVVLGSDSIVSNHPQQSLDTIVGLCEGFHTLTLTDDKNCSASLHINSSSLNPVEILEGEDVTSSIDAQSVAGSLECYGDLGMSASILTPDARFTYDWYLDGILVLSDTITAWNLGGGQLTAVASFLGCEASSAAVTLQQPDDLVLNAQSIDIACNGASTGSISTNAQGGTGLLTYDWSTGSSTSDLSALMADTYTLMVTDANNCEWSSSFVLSEPSALVLSVNVIGAQLSAVVSGGVQGYSYDWQLNNQTVSTSANFIASQTGYYVLTITDANGCQETETNYVDVSVGIGTEQDLPSVSVYPNPAQTEFKIEIDTEDTFTYELMSYKGDVVLRGEVRGEALVKVADLAAGLYFLQVINEDIIFHDNLILR